jgi:hypothetical protein
MMKKVLIILLAVFAFACSKAENKSEDTNRDIGAVNESVEKGAGEEISPQLEIDSDTARDLKVDTISSAQEEHQRQKEYQKREARQRQQ